MALEQKLRLKMVQKLIMTPSLQQAIKLLQLNRLDLVEEIAQELVENPVLEEQEEVEPVREAEETEEEQPEDERNAMDEVDLDYYFREWEQSQAYSRATTHGMQETPDLPSIENTPAPPPSLADHLLVQLADLATTPEQQEIGKVLVGNLSDEGYLQATIEEIRTMGGWEEEEVLKVLGTLQRLDPVGVGSRDLTECLLLQLREIGLLGGPCEEIVRHHLPLLRSHRYDELSKRLGATEKEARDYADVVKHLDPKPGLRYSSERAQYITPDVFVVKVDDEFKILLNEEGLPRLRISPVYRKMIEKGNAASKEEKSYVREKFRSALWFLKSLDERQRTIYKVANSIVQHQKAFFEQGIEQLRPLILRDVAEDVEMHESTVSRVVNNKYMHTPRGLFELKFFFHSGISRDYQEDISSLAVKKRIAGIIKEENSQKPYSDSKIAKILKEDGLRIARRTVAKYREEVGIPASPVRKRM